MALPYNGYSPKQRCAISAARQKIEAASDASALAYLNSGRPCEVCGDPQPPPSSWHSEDYSIPFIWEPPATFIVCEVCHNRLHKRFTQPWAWLLFCLHVRAGGYGYEFAKLHGLQLRQHWMNSISAGGEVGMPLIRERRLTGNEWWQKLTLDPESLKAPWARPRPYRSRPTAEAYGDALQAAAPTDRERAVLKHHAAMPKRCATMRQLANRVFGTDQPGTINLMYGRLAHRIAQHLSWAPDTRVGDSAIWMSVVAEGWQPKGRDYEWVMIEALSKAL